MNLFINKIKPFLYLGSTYLLLSLILRLVLIFHPITEASFSILEIIEMLFLGMLGDFPIFILGSSFLAIYFLFISNNKYNTPWGGIILLGHLLFLCYIRFFPNNIFKQYGGSVEEIATIFVLFKTSCFALMFAFKKHRNKIRNIFYFCTLFLFILVMVQNSVSEFFFWNEFGIRYNFIAVDYLIYTNEVIGNIMESYPVIPLFSAVITITFILTTFIFIRTRLALKNLPTLMGKLFMSVGFLILFIISLLSVEVIQKLSESTNTFSREIKSNGIYKFYYAFTHSELDFFQFYPTIDSQKAETTFFEHFETPQLLRSISSEKSEIKKNVVLISVESLSAEFMAHYGNKQNITPFLDSLAQKSLFFTNFYATGNRTVRGLEALTLCVPPTAGESIVKRKDNKDKFSIGSVFKSKGYQVKYLYGGYSYFDNMNDFFSSNGYDIVDRSHFSDDEISFANIWGVCDEDMAKKAILTMNEQAKNGKPFFNHWMTVSNHRPFTYPDGKIDIPSNSKTREGGVKYTDYALKKFFEMAKKQDWYEHTVFVIVSDHCASSSGKIDLPLERYRIPALIFAPNFIEPRQEEKLTSQIDLMPTLLGILHMSYESKFLGQDVFSPHYKPRAFIATYQDLGYIEDDILTIISPVNKIKQYKIIPEKVTYNTSTLFFEQKPINEPIPYYTQQCISAYQTASKLLKEQKLNRK